MPWGTRGLKDGGEYRRDAACGMRGTQQEDWCVSRTLLPRWPGGRGDLKMARNTAETRRAGCVERSKRIGAFHAPYNYDWCVSRARRLQWPGGRGDLKMARSTAETRRAGCVERSKRIGAFHAPYSCDGLGDAWDLKMARSTAETRRAGFVERSKRIGAFHAPYEPPRLGFELAWSFLWVMPSQSVRSGRVPRRDVTHGDGMVSVKIFRPEKCFVCRGPPEKNHSKMHNFAQSPCSARRTAALLGGAVQTDQPRFGALRPGRPSCRDGSPTIAPVCFTLHFAVARVGSGWPATPVYGRSRRRRY
jgi:hypothetical protein